MTTAFDVGTFIFMISATLYVTYNLCIIVHSLWKMARIGRSTKDWEDHVRNNRH